MRPRTLYGKTLATIAVVSAGFLLFMSAVFAKFLLIPMRDRSTEDLTRLMQESAARWVVAPAPRRPALAEALHRRYGLYLQEVRPELPERGLVLPYFYFLEDALARQVGEPVRLRVDDGPDGAPRFWAAVPTTGGDVDVGVPQSYIAVQPPLALFLVLTVGTLATMVTAVLLVRRLTAPLERLARSARRLGSGDWPEPVPETGPEELAQLAGSFNRMVVQVQELLANRTTLLAGISHDLRTPLARLQIAIEMLPYGSDRDLMERIRADLGHMNTLIGQFLGVAKGLEDPNQVMIELYPLLEDLADATRRGGAEVILRPGKACRIEASEVALRRILGNLLDNAARYGHGAPIELEWHCADSRVFIHVLDRGPGIPEHQAEAVFRPFYRLEGSRNRTTGGSGLGLAIARQLALANGWEIKLVSRHGGGTRAVLQLGKAEPVG